MNFSIVLPSRGDLKEIRKMLDSFERTTKYKNRIEFLIAVNSKKKELDRFIKDQSYSFSIRTFQRPKTKDFTNDYYNWLANKSTGDNIMVFNDDAWMRTKHWDDKILRTIKEYGWSIYLLDIPDTTRLKNFNMFPCFPCVSRRSFLTLGFVLCKDVRMYPADKFTHSIFFNCQRIVPIRNVLIEHEHIVETDDSKKDLMEIFNEDFEKQKTIDLSDYIYKLLLVCGSESNKRSKLKRIINILKEK